MMSVFIFKNGTDAGVLAVDWRAEPWGCSCLLGTEAGTPRTQLTTEDRGWDSLCHMQAGFPSAESNDSITDVRKVDGPPA